MNRIYLLLALICNSAANILMKLGSKNSFLIGNSIAQTISNNIYILFGGFLFGLNMIFYILAIKNINLSVAYPIMIGFTLIIVTTFSYFYFGENISWFQVLGYILIYVGIILIFVYKK